MEKRSPSSTRSDVSNHEGDKNKLNVLIFLDVDPHGETRDYINLREEVMHTNIVAYVAPYQHIADKTKKYYKGAPLVSWEEPNSEELRKYQYHFLYQASKADAVIHLGWKYPIPKQSEAGVIRIHPLIYKDFSGINLSVLIHIKLHHSIPKGYEQKKT
jgi:hypothetical protein